jgi:hypothetical protein
VRVNGDLGGSGVAGGAGLHFDKTEPWPLPCDQVHIAGQVARRPAPRHHGVTLAAQVEEGRVLALDAGGQVDGHVIRLAAPARCPFETGQRALLTADPHPLHPSHGYLFSTE